MRHGSHGNEIHSLADSVQIEYAVQNLLIGNILPVLELDNPGQCLDSHC